jgi:beta-phosphoglucomutase-like phosphatase (HAD superfamily)
VTISARPSRSGRGRSEVKVPLSASGDPDRPRVRPHVACAVGGTRHVLLDFDDVMFNLSDTLRRRSREQAIAAFLQSRPYRPRPLSISFAWDGLYRVLAYLAAHEPDHAVEAERIVSDLELDAALAARPATGLERLLTSCAVTDRRVAVISSLSESAVLGTLRAHDLDRQIAGVAARHGLDMSFLGTAPAIERAADLIGAPVPTCLVVSGNTWQLWTARRVGAVGLGCEGGRDPRRHLAVYAPVVPRLATLSQALLNG